MSLYVFYHSTIFYVFATPLSALDRESTACDQALISFNTTYLQVDGYATAVVSRDKPVSWPVLTLVMIHVNSHGIHFV